MKLLHTSDWHLGHSLYGFDRLEEQQDMLRQIIEIVRQEKPDALLISGDVYHTTQPSTTIQHLYADTISELHRISPEMSIFVTAGNHDSPSRHEVFSTPWRSLNVYSVGTVPADNIDELIFEIPNKGFVIAVPYVHARNMPEDLYKKLVDRCEELNVGGLPIIMMAHTSVSGAHFNGHDHSNEVTIGGIDCVSADKFGHMFDYLALGHIHKPQTLRKRDPMIRYSGTPLSVSFDEDFQHSVTIIDIPKRGDTPQIELIQIKNPRPLISVPKNSFKPFDEVLDLLKEIPDDIPAYVRLNIAVDDFLPHNAREEVLQVLKDKRSRFCHFNVVRNNDIEFDGNGRLLNVSEFRTMAPIEIARRFARDTSIELSDEQIKLLTDLFDVE